MALMGPPWVSAELRVMMRRRKVTVESQTRTHLPDRLRMKVARCPNPPPPTHTHPGRHCFNRKSVKCLKTTAES